MDKFSLHKTQSLARKDSSRRGRIDRKIIRHVRLLNSHHDFYTTSSCSGRIMAIAKDESAKKCDCAWLYSTHGKAAFGAVMKALAASKSGLVWIKQEAFILHVAARDIEAARKLLKLVRQSGLKHSGIFSLQDRIMLEIEGNEHMDVPVMRDGKLMVSEVYIKEVLKIANSKMDLNEVKLERFLSYIKNL